MQVPVLSFSARLDIDLLPLACILQAGLLLICVLFAVCEGPEKAGVLLNIASVVARLSTPHDDPWPRCLALRQEARQSIVWFDYSVLMC